MATRNSPTRSTSTRNRHWQRTPSTTILALALLFSACQTTCSFVVPRTYGITRSSPPTRTSTGALSYATIPEEDRKLSSFEKRMRNIVLERNKKPQKSRQQQRKESLLPPNLKVVHTLQEYKTTVAGEKQTMVIVRFFATWCKACRAMAPFYYRLTKNHPELKFVEVPITDQNADLHQGLGVPSIPFGHIYHPESGLIEEMKISKKHFRKFEKVVEDYMRGYCELVDGECNSPYEMNEN